MRVVGAVGDYAKGLLRYTGFDHGGHLPSKKAMSVA